MYVFLIESYSGNNDILFKNYFIKAVQFKLVGLVNLLVWSRSVLELRHAILETLQTR